VLKGEHNRVATNDEITTAWDSESQFDAGKDKSQFRQYEEACERVKNFYREQHGKLS
jgi:inositol oxygenase